MTRFAGLVLVLSALSAAACGGDEPLVRWTLLAPLPPGASLSALSVSLRAGTSIAARPTMLDENGMELSCEVQLTSLDPEVLKVDAAERGSFALTGNSAGETSIVVQCGDESVRIAGRVTA